jgi:hypothetical protein
VSPNLFIVGFQKCGSSTLFHLLSQHPDISGSKPKETFVLTDNSYEHYKVEKSVNNPSFNWGDYFSHSIPTPYRVEASVCNFYQETALNYIKSLKQKKVIFIVRDPVERFISTYYYYGGNGIHLKSGVSLDDYFYLALGRDESLTKEPMRFSIEHGNYLKYIQRWSDTIGEANIMIVGFKEIIHNPLSACNRIFDFLGLGHLDSVNTIHKNQTFVSRAPNVNRFLVDLLGGNSIWPKFIKDVYRKLMSVPTSKHSLNDSIVQLLKEIYSNEYKNLKGYF